MRRLCQKQTIGEGVPPHFFSFALWSLSEASSATSALIALDPWASACERTSYAPGQLAKFWPILIEPHGRIHFVGAYADNLNWGMEAATRSANRIAEAIHQL